MASKAAVVRRALWRGKRTRALWWSSFVILTLGVALCGTSLYVAESQQQQQQQHLGTHSSRQLLQTSTSSTPSPENSTVETNSTDDSDDGTYYPPSLLTDEEIQKGGFVLYLMGILYMFFALAIVCDDYFVPALEEITERLQLSDDVAGATFMAAGGSAPELFTSVLGEFVAQSNIGFGTIVGSATFNVMFVIGACAFATVSIAPDGLPLTWWPLFRDSTFYAVDLGLLSYFFSDKVIKWYESLILFLMYGVYVGFMSRSESIQKAVQNKLSPQKIMSPTPADAGVAAGNASISGSAGPNGGPQSFAKLSKFYDSEMQTPLRSLLGEPDSSEASLANPLLTEDAASVRRSSFSETRGVVALGDDDGCNVPLEGDAEDDEEEDELWEPTGWPVRSSLRVLRHLVLFPINFVLWATVPNCAREERKSWFIPSFAMCIMWIAVFTYMMVWWAESLGHAIPIPSEVMGYTLLAAGTSVPDLITSVLVARLGRGDMAVSSSIGSNIFDITFGLPVPWLLRAFASNFKEKHVESKSLGASVVMLILMLMSIIGAIAMMGWRLNVKLGILCLVLYVIFVAVSLLLEYEVITLF